MCIRNRTRTGLRDFRPFQVNKPIWVSCEQVKTISRNWSILQRYLRKLCVSVVADFADSILAQSLTTQTQNLHSCWLRGPGVRVVSTYVVKVMNHFLTFLFRKQTKWEINNNYIWACCRRRHWPRMHCECRYHVHMHGRWLRRHHVNVYSTNKRKGQWLHRHWQ